MIKLYAIYDAITATYGNFFVAKNDEDAKRIVINAFGKHPFVNDFVLHYTGVAVNTESCMLNVEDGNSISTIRGLIDNE